MGTCEFRQLDGHTVFAVLLIWEGLGRAPDVTPLRLATSVGLSLALIIVAALLEGMLGTPPQVVQQALGRQFLSG